MEKRVTCHRYLTVILLICFASIYQVSSNPVEKSKTNMLQKIAVCDTVNFVKNSSYLSECNKIAYSTVVNEQEKNAAMCMIVYDITNKICAYNSQTFVNNKIKVPETSQQLDAEVKKLEPKPDKSSNFINNQCKNMTTIFKRLNSIAIDSPPDVIPFIEYVNGNLLTAEECPFTCHGINQRVNSFCMFLLWANELFANVKPIKPQSKIEESLPVKSAPASVTNTQKQTVQQNTKTVVIEAKKKANPVHNNETPVSVDKTPSLNKAEKSLPVVISGNTEQEEVKQSVDVPDGNKVIEEQKESEIQKPIDEVKEESMPLPVGNDKTSSVASKALDNNPESPNIVQPEKANPEDFNSAEDPPIKKSDDADIDDGNAHDGVEDKDPMDDGSFAANNMGNPQEIPSNKKFYAQSSLVKEEDESHFFAYFSVLSLLCVGLYVGYHNKQKILAMVLEGRRSRRGRGSRRRPSTASYRKLDSNLEEAVTSQCNSNVTHVIY